MAPDDNGLDDFNPDEFEEFQNEGQHYGDVPELGGMESQAALQSLTLFRRVRQGFSIEAQQRPQWVGQPHRSVPDRSRPSRRAKFSRGMK